MKKKVHLNELLAKYEGNTYNAPSAHYYSPAKEYEYQETPIEQEFYQSRTYQQPRVEAAGSQPITGNFQMSKSECENFLIRVREELRNEQRSMVNFADNSIKHIHERFHANHEKIKRQILDLLEKAFRDNERYITEELKRQNSSQPEQFIPVHRKIAAIDEDINRLLYGLKGSDYRRSIAETVVKDYNVELNSLKESVKSAKQLYLSSLGEVEPDRARIDCIKQDLQRLFRLSKKTAGLVQQSLFSALKSRFNNEEAPRAATTYVPPAGGAPKEKEKKRYFNFGFNE